MRPENNDRKDALGSAAISRRGFLHSAGIGVASAAMESLFVASTRAASPTPGILFEGLAVPMRPGVQEATLAQRRDGLFWLLFGEKKALVVMNSHDHGRTWEPAKPLLTQLGGTIPLARDTAHLSLLHLKSGKLGLLYGGPVARPGRDGTVLFRTSEDEGMTWSEPTVVEPLFALCRSGSARVLRSGRIVAPTLKWISPAAGPESEDEARQFVFTWVNYSDDEGQTWHKSLSELFISVESGGCRGFYASFDEPVLEQTGDGSLLMVARTQLGRPYKSASRDEGVSWSNPQPMQIASSISPHTLARIPTTGDLLLVWNQASVEEDMTGLQRARLSTAISPDSGKTWTHFRNLESFDDRAHIEPPPPEPKVYLMDPWKYVEPTDHTKYPRAPGCLRVTYPTVTFWENQAVFSYDYGDSPGHENDNGTKIKIVSLDWLYERV